MQKYLEFMSHPLLKQLLLYSIKGETLNFVSAFNRLTEDECPKYSNYKIGLYDINQRRYIVKVHGKAIEDNMSEISDGNSNSNRGQLQKPLKRTEEISLVHYNGFVFGSNTARMITIREREANIESEVSEDSESEAD